MEPRHTVTLKEYRRNERTSVTWHAAVEIMGNRHRVQVLDFSIRGFGVRWPTDSKPQCGDSACIQLLEGPLAELTELEVRIARVELEKSCVVGLDLTLPVKPRILLLLANVRQDVRQSNSHARREQQRSR